jgi:glycosyltransferase involved in cell wall biosynthesis
MDTRKRTERRQELPEAKQAVRASARQMPEVSVICTARNAGRTIATAINTILNQDFTDWEMLIIDDGSTDETFAIVHDYYSDRRLKLYSDEHMGRSTALNYALDLAEADLVAVIDADDLAHPQRLGLQRQAMLAEPGIVVLGAGAVPLLGIDGPLVRVDGSDLFPPVERLSDIQVLTKKEFRRSNPLVHSSVMYRREAVRAIGGYTNLPNAVDYDLFVRCLEAGYLIGWVPEVLTGKRLHPGQHFAGLPNFSRLKTSISVQRRAGASMAQCAARAAWMMVPRNIRDYVRAI